MTELLVVGLGGFLGAIARYGLSGWMHRLVDSSFPSGTLCVNVVGCFFMGAVMGFAEQRQLFAPHTRLLLTMGFLGSLTTFSTFGYETFALLQDGQLVLCVWNLAANVVLGLGGVALAWAAVNALAI